MITAVIPVWNGKVMLARLLEKLKAQTKPPAEILVVDNGSADGSAEEAERGGARVILMGRNAGFARAVNCGVEQCRTPLVAIVNNDVEPEADWLEQLEAALDDRSWFATGKLLQPGGAKLDGTFDALCRGGTAWRVGHGRADGPLYSQPARIWLASATATLYRTELFARAGLLDADFESYLEDVDFSLRCACLGLGGVYVPGAVASHIGSATLGRWHPDTVRRIARNQVLLLAKHYPDALLRRYIWPILVAHGLWGFVALRNGRLAPYLRGKIQGFRQYSSVRARRAADCPGEQLAKILQDGERKIRMAQASTGYDWYWKVYFLLTTSGAN